jgi:nucleoid-associated protein YgaU
MRRARILLFLLLVAGGAAAIYGLRNGWELPPVPNTDKPAAMAPSERREAEASSVRPTFDIVRAEPTGELVMAGRAEPGWTVTVESGGKTLGTAVADQQGEWVITPAAPVKKGEHSLELKAQSPQGVKMLFSKQRLALSIGESNKSRPLVALTEEGAATRVLQMSPPVDDKRASAQANAAPSLQNPPFKPAAAPAETPAQVTFTSIDYEQASGQSMVYLSGRGVPGGRVMLYADNEFIGTTTVDATGSWTFKSLRELKAGSHPLRADHVDLASGKVLARAEVNFDREAPKTLALADEVPGASQIGLASGGRPAGPGTSAGAASSPPSTTGTPSVGQAENKPFIAETEPGGVIVVRRGDTLWQIAQRTYGSGAKYTQIFQSNRGQIRNPDLIYPSQRFTVPDRVGAR